ncbi:porin family protein [Bartonella alsatica]|uniref:Porin n=2 Tax=Bartonella alsatica TaxID=52764 RepID=J0YMB8_9HYPH|nr:porin [Bartonella alsatica]EJF75763.1 hypothetical protein MEC_00318 [Bartonella alsatica IBS 382]QLC51582.1 porin family protein [Bartonella alsatica]
MNTKYLVTISAFAFFSVSIVEAADAIISQQPAQVVSSIATPTFSWQGFYFGGQIGGFSSKLSAMAFDDDSPFFSDEESKHKKWVPVEEKYLPKLSGFVGGFYAGANVDLGNSFILGVDTDVFLSGRKKTQTIVVIDEKNAVLIGRTDQNKSDNVKKERIHDLAKQVIEQSVRGSVNGVSQSNVGDQRAEKHNQKQDHINFSHTLKQKWTGATRVRVGFSANRIMPYIAGGVAYGQLQDILSLSITGEENLGAKLDKTKTMVGYTFGGGVDFAMTDNIILRTEYRYSDFGKKKFGDKIELNYKTNDFRFGIAYKF